MNMKTYVYKTVGDVQIHADVYRAEDVVARPVLVYQHGGALIFGTPREVAEDLRELCRAEGYILVAAEYRLAPEVKLPQIVEDVQDCMRWVAKKGPALFHADASRIVVAGGSAGGYLAMMTGLGQPRPKAIVSYWGYGDVDGAWYTQPSEYYRKAWPLVTQEEAYSAVGQGVLTETHGGPVEKGRVRFYRYMRQSGLWTKEITGFDPATDARKLDPYCPVRNITPQYPPTLMIHGVNDEDVPCQKSLDMAEQLKRNGVRSELITIEGGGHGLSGGEKQKIADARAKAREFIKEYLR
jgi:acetyl esterase/lipase